MTKSDNFSLFGNYDFILNESTRMSFGARLEDYEANYSDSFEESFNPSDKMSGGKISLNKIAV